MIYDDYLEYKKCPIIFGNSKVKLDVFLTMKYLEFHISDSLRCIKSFNNLNCYNSQLYGNVEEKKNRISYYHHYMISLLTNLGLIIEGQKTLESIIGGKIYDFMLEKGARNTIVHIFEKTTKYYNMGIKVNGFNVIEDENDLKFRDIKTPLGTLDLIDNRILIYGDNKSNKKEEDIKSYTIDLIKLKMNLENYLIEIKHFNEYINNFFQVVND